MAITTHICLINLLISLKQRQESGMSFATVRYGFPMVLSPALHNCAVGTGNLLHLIFRKLHEAIWQPF